MAGRSTSLNLLYPPFLVRLLRGLKSARKAGIPLDVFETWRSYKRQEELYSQGRTRPGKIVTRAQPGRSWHTYGVAADLVLKIDGRWTWEHHDLYEKGAPYLESEGLRWLGRGPGIVDMAHYELPIDFSIYEAKRLYETYGVQTVWERMNQAYGDSELWDLF